MSTAAQDSSKRPIVISGPSGAGKSTIIKRLFDQYPGRFGFSISHTTRAPRGAEQNGREYHFVTREAFEQLIADGGFIEHAKFGSNLYGTSFATVNEITSQDKQCILDIEMEGVKSIKAHPDFASRVRFLFLSPPSPEVLEQRLRGRGTDKEEDILNRLEQAKKEMEFAKTGVHDKVVVNDDLDKAYEEVRYWLIDEA